jgi:GT2 family glycosyltransferase
MSISKKVWVVIPNWNGARFLAECLESIEPQTLKAEIVVVDGASSDGSAELVRQKFPHVKLVELEHNQGFAGNVNRGLEFALRDGAEYIALFNNDAVADKDWLKMLVAAAETHPDAGIITGKLLHFDRRHIDSTGDFYSSWGFSFPRGRDELDTGQYNRGQQVFGASGGASLYSAQMLKQIGLFDEAFFAYFEDVDISFRAQLAGWKVYYEPEAVAYHRIGGTSSQISGFARYHTIKNFFYLYTKNMPGWLYWKYFPKFAIAGGLIVASSVKRGQFGPLFKGLGKALLTLPPTLWKRQKIQALKKASNHYIDSILYHPMPPTQKTLLGLRRRLRPAK